MIKIGNLEKDFGQILAFCYKTFKENKLEPYGVEPSFEKMANSLVEDSEVNIVFVKHDETTEDKEIPLLDGVMVIRASEVWWSEKPVLGISLFYVKEEKRSLKLVSEFLREAKEYAIIQGVPLIADIIDTDPLRARKKRVLYTRAGFKEVGSFLIFNPAS